MNCSSVDLKAYFLGETAGLRKVRWKIMCMRARAAAKSWTV